MEKMKLRKPQQANEPSLLDELSKPLRDFVSDFKQHGADALQKVRENNPEKYLELSTKLLPLVAAFNPGTSDFSDCQNMQDIGAGLLRSIGFDEPDDISIQAAIDANDAFTQQLGEIVAKAQSRGLN